MRSCLYLECIQEVLFEELCATLQGSVCRATQLSMTLSPWSVILMQPPLWNDCEESLAPSSTPCLFFCGRSHSALCYLNLLIFIMHFLPWQFCLAMALDCNGTNMRTLPTSTFPLPACHNMQGGPARKLPHLMRILRTPIGAFIQQYPEYSSARRWTAHDKRMVTVGRGVLSSCA